MRRLPVRMIKSWNGRRHDRPKRLDPALAKPGAHLFPASNFIHSALHNPETGELHVLFYTGASATHVGVPAELFAELQAAESAGYFYNSRIRNHFAKT